MNKLEGKTVSLRQMEASVHAGVRQGDVLLRRLVGYNGEISWLSHCPPGTPVQGNVLALGEKTGHSHTVEGDFQLVKTPGGTLYLRVKEGEARIVHQEHATITVPEGSYEVRVQKEFDELEGVRPVSD